MATGNIGRPGVGVNPLRGQNNVHGACDMGSFPHELPGYRHISGDEARASFEALWNVKLNSEPGQGSAFYVYLPVTEREEEEGRELFR